MGTKDFFDGLADRWDEINRYPMEKLELMLDMTGIKPGDTVLDAGTGTGVLLPLLMKRTGPECITAIDLSEKMIERAKCKAAGQAIGQAAGQAAGGAAGGAACSSVHFIAADIMEYQFAANSFNHIICYSVFPHFEDKRKAIEIFSASLKPGGLLSVLHSSSRERVNGTHTHIRSHSINSDYLLPAREYISLLNRNGLKEERVIDDDEMFVLCARKLYNTIPCP